MPPCAAQWRAWSLSWYQKCKVLTRRTGAGGRSRRTHCRELKNRRSCIRTAMPSSMLPIGRRLQAQSVSERLKMQWLQELTARLDAPKGRVTSNVHRHRADPYFTARRCVCCGLLRWRRRGATVRSGCRYSFPLRERHTRRSRLDGWSRPRWEHPQHCVARPCRLASV